MSGFSWLDYLLFSVMVLSSTIIGIYFGWKNKKSKTIYEYLFGGKTLKVVPVTISLIASNISSVLLMGVPSDVYQFGASVFWASASILIAAPFFLYFYMPVLLKEEYNTVFEYLEVRFNRKIRLLSSALFVLQVLLNSPMLIFIPSLALAQVTGISLHAISTSMCGICIFYTAIGGLRGVVWTDTLQTFIMYLALLIIFINGIIICGGFGKIWNASLTGDRLDILRFNFDATDRENSWSIAIGYFVIFLNGLVSNQSTIQRLMSVPTYNHSLKIIWIFFAGMVLTMIVCSLMGLVIYTYYEGCDPLMTHKISRYDQILPYYIGDVGKSLPGLPGLFVAGIFSAALSSLSTYLNTLSGVLYTNFLSSHVNVAEKNKELVLKLIVISTGMLCIALIFIVEHLGGIMHVTTTFIAITGGPLLALFTLGVAVPRANSKSAFVGGIIGMLFVTFIAVGNYYYRQMGFIIDTPKKFSIEKCATFENTTINYRLLRENQSSQEVFILFRISFWNYTLIGCSISVIVGYISSFLTNNGNERNVKKELIAPVLHFLLPDNSTQNDQLEDPTNSPIEMVKDND